MAFTLARDAAVSSLKSLSSEVLDAAAFRVCDRELDDFTKVRNTFALAGAACWQILANEASKDGEFHRTVELAVSLIKRGRTCFWGEGALSQFVTVAWLLERGDQHDTAKSMLTDLLTLVAERNHRDSNEALEDPYSSADECLVKFFKSVSQAEKSRRQAVESYSLFPMVLLAARRGMRSELEKAWMKISRVVFTWFEPARPVDALLWHCGEGKEYTDIFAQPQSWKQLSEIAFRDRQERLPKVLREDLTFGVLFMLAFPHRTMPSLVKHLDTLISRTIQ